MLSKKFCFTFAVFMTANFNGVTTGCRFAIFMKIITFLGKSLKNTGPNLLHWQFPIVWIDNWHQTNDDYKGLLEIFSLPFLLSSSWWRPLDDCDWSNIDQLNCQTVPKNLSTHSQFQSISRYYMIYIKISLLELTQAFGLFYFI